MKHKSTGESRRPAASKAASGAPPPSGASPDRKENITAPAKSRSNRFFPAGLGLFILVAVLLFKARLFLMGDDADYILDAYNFVHNGIYPAGRASLYGMILGLPVALFGTHVLLLKCFSFLCAIAAWILCYRAFHNRIPSFILYAVLLFTAISHHIQYYSSSNLSEAFFMMIQYGYLFICFTLISRLNQPGEKHIKYWLLAGLGALLISLSKNIAVVAPVSLCLFFLLKKEWRNAILALMVFLVFKIPYELLIRAIYGANTVVGQMGQVLAKDLYHHEYGQETFGGFLDRFWLNSHIYFSGSTMQSFGINIGPGGVVITALLIMGLLLFGLRTAYVKKNDYMLMAGLYTGVMTVATFFALQPAVAQDRIIIILIPLFLMIILYGLYELAGKLRLSAKWVLGVPMVILSVPILTNTAREIEKSFSELTENLSGDTFYGYTPDWIHYLEMGQWINENIPADSVIAARKPNSLTIYSNGRPFYGIYNFPTDKSPDELLEMLKSNRVSYMVLAPIRINPEQYIPNYFISTLHNYVQKISEKYPEKFKLVHQTEGPEASMLVKIEY